MRTPSVVSWTALASLAEGVGLSHSSSESRVRTKHGLGIPEAPALWPEALAAGGGGPPASRITPSCLAPSRPAGELGRERPAGRLGAGARSPLLPDALGHPREARLPDWGGDGGLAGRPGTLDGAV